MSLTQWNAFVEVSRTGSIRAAAEATGFTQPGLSRQIAALERAVGAQLLHRGPRGVSLTTSGSALLPHARLVVNEARRGLEAAREAPQYPATLLVGSVPSAAACLVPATVGLLTAAAGPSCVIVTGLTPHLTSMVINRELDAAVISDAPPGLPRDSQLRLRHVADDEMIVLLAPAHRLAGRRRIDIVELAEETWIEDNAGSEAILRGLAAKAGFEPRLSLNGDGLLTKSGLVAAGLGVALVPGLLRPALRSDLVMVRLDQPAKRGVYLASRTDRSDLDQFETALHESSVRMEP